MKLALLAFCLFCTSAAFAQVASISAEPQITEFHSHAEHASQHDLGQAQIVMEQSGPYSAHGSRPLWELGTVPREPSLGEVARMLKEQHATEPKAKVIWTN